MRVALFSETFLPKIDGIAKVACLTLEHFQRRGIEAMIAVPEQGVRDYAGAEVIGMPSRPNPFYPESRISMPTPGIYRRIKAFNPDIMHSFHPIMVGMSGFLMAKRMKKPVIASFHLDMARITTFYKVGFLKKPVDKLTTFVFNQANYSLAPSRYVQDMLRQQGVKKVGLWRRGVDAENFHPRFRDADMRNLLSDGHPNDIVLLYVGRLAVEKQIQQLKIILECIPRTRLALVGGGPYQAELEHHFAGLPVKFVGYLRGQALSTAYASADIFVFPSAFESFGLVILEAMASGLPVVSSRVGGAQDMITEGVSGYTFDVNDVDALRQSVQNVIGEPGKLQKMRLAAREQAEKQSWPHIMDELIDCYQAILMGEPSPI